MNDNYKVLSQEISVVNGELVVIKTTEEKLTKEDLLTMQVNFRKQKQSLVNQMNLIKQSYDELTAKESEVESLLAQIPAETPQIPTLE